MTILDKVKETILTYKMLSKGDSVVIALSGGPDSVVALHLLKQLESQYKLKLFIGHLNHGLRGGEAFLDQKFCEELGEKLEIPVYTAKVYIKSLKKKEAGKSIEDLARRERYKFLEKLAKKVNASKIVLGHTADDQVETVIMRFIRGAGTKGLSGIPPKRRLVSGIWIVRPLISVFREGILEYLRKKKILYVEDSTNKELIFFRNKIRHELLPLLSKYNPNIKNIIQSTGTNMALINNYLEEVVEKEFRAISNITKDCVKVNSDKLNSCHPALSQMLICRIMKEIDPSVQLESQIVKKVLVLVGDTSGSKIINLPKGIKVSREYGKLFFSKGKRRINKKKYIAEMALNGKTRISKRNILITSKLCKENGSSSYLSYEYISNLHNIFQKKRLSFKADLDYDTLLHPLIIRNRRLGDVFHPIGMKGTKKVKDIFIDEKVPRAYRDEIPIFVSGNEICWIVGYRIGEKFKVKLQTKRILRIKVTCN